MASSRWVTLINLFPFVLQIPDASSLELEQATAGPSLKKPAEEVVGVASYALAKKPEDSTPSKSKTCI